MKILGFEIKKDVEVSKTPTVEARGNSTHLFSVGYNGEKNTGELGPLINYDLDYLGLRARSWESYLSSEITQTVVGRFSMWVIGSGLKLQSEPVVNILKEKNIEVNSETIKSIENRFRLYANSKMVDFSERKNLHQIARTAYVNSIVGGDVLTVLRYENEQINVQLISGSSIVQPYLDNHLADAIGRGNTVVNGIEIDKRGRHVAFFVKTGGLEVERILAKNPKSGREVAFLICGLEYRITDNRGLPLFSAVLETLKKLDRYKEAVVGSAEERAKIPFVIEHGVGSTGENPISRGLAKAFDADSDQEIPTDINGKQLQDNVAATMNKTVINLPQDASLKSLESKAEINFSDFYSPNVNSVCSTIGMPPEVALSKYDSNFSSARAALKDWEHTLQVKRKDFSSEFYDKIYKFWLEIEILKQNIQADGYITALVKNDTTTLDAYRNSRFVGANVPHIDPVKEVTAERLKLGETGKSIPLTTAEAATEALNGGEYDSNVVQYAEELKDSKTKGIEVVIQQPQTNETTTKKDKKDD